MPYDVYLPDMPNNAPTIGWREMYARYGKDIAVPASVEDYFAQGRRTWQYKGVSWFWRTVNVPADWKGKTVRLQVDNARLRAEIYVNEKLAGYDIVPETPFAFDISEFLNYGQENRLAIRITSPGGTRGWEDTPRTWGGYTFTSTKNFSGLGGGVRLVATSPCYVEDVFVKNLQPAGARRVSIQATLHNRLDRPQPLELSVEIRPAQGGAAVFQQSWRITADAYDGASLQGHTATVVQHEIEVPAARLWSVEEPNLYTARVTLRGAGIEDAHAVRFGFRVFEAKAVDGKQNLYVNGQRIRHRSAIDWGYYSKGGFYATPELAQRSVAAAKALNQNGINFHRQVGQPAVMDAADELGLFLYEEPGAFHIAASEVFGGEITLEKLRRMAIRERNHPSMIWFNLANENDRWDSLRERAMRLLHGLDDTRMVTNSSPWSSHIRHMRPYESDIRLELSDYHTVNSYSRFSEAEDLGSHPLKDDAKLRYWGEVRCFTGPSNWFKTAEEQRSNLDGGIGYDCRDTYLPLHDKIVELFTRHRLAETGSRVIASPAEVSTQAGRGLMYCNGRVAQSILLSNSIDGYAINGWTNGSEDPRMGADWDSAILDEARNLKGPAQDMAYWTRPLQVAIQRRNGKYFQPGDKAIFAVHLINEHRLPAGAYTLELTVTDGAGKPTAFRRELPVTVVGGDVFAQPLIEELSVPLEATWHGGYITVKGTLLASSGQVVADGAEQVLLKNRPSFASDLQGLRGAVLGWEEAKTALTEAGAVSPEFVPGQKNLQYIAAGATADMGKLSAALRCVQDEGTVLLVRFSPEWAAALHQAGILSSPVTEWGGEQTGFWTGNGWGYLDHFIGNQAVPSQSTIGTNGWEVPCDPYGFYPLQSGYPTNVYGAFFARDNQLLILNATIRYGKGRIVLAPAYPLGSSLDTIATKGCTIAEAAAMQRRADAFADLLFFNMLAMGCRNQWAVEPAPQASAGAVAPVAQVKLTSPASDATIPSGPVEIRGTAAGMQAVALQIRDGGGKLIGRGQASVDASGRWSSSAILREGGDYVIRASAAEAGVDVGEAAQAKLSVVQSASNPLWLDRVAGDGEIISLRNVQLPENARQLWVKLKPMAGGVLELRRAGSPAVLARLDVPAAECGLDEARILAVPLSGPVAGMCDLEIHVSAPAGKPMGEAQWLLTPPAGQTPPHFPLRTAASDEFNAAHLAPGWRWANEDATHWSLTGSGLRIRTQKDSGKNILMRDLSGDWILVAKLDLKDASGNPASPAARQQFGLQVRKDAKTYLTARMFFSSKDPVMIFAILTGYSNRTVPAPLVQLTREMDARTIFFRLQKRGDIYRFACSADGEKWCPAGELRMDLGDQVKVGLYGNNDNAAGIPEVNGDWDFFRVYQ